jgi:hypothetical protein
MFKSFVKIFLTATTLPAAMLLVAMLMISGCSKKGDDVIGPDKGGGNGGGNTCGNVSGEQRRVAIDSINAFANGLTGSPSSDNARIVAFAKSLSVIEDAGIESGNSWARFKDGKVMLIGGFRPTVEGGGQQKPQSGNSSNSFTRSTVINSAQGHSSPSSASGSTTLDPDMPISNQIRLLNSLGPAFDPISFGDGFTSTIEDLKDWFTVKVGGYNMPGSDRAEVSDLKGAWGDGVFYLSAHGAKGRLRDGSGMYGIWTSTPVTPTNDILYANDLDSGYLCIYSAIHERSPIPITGRGVYTSHYAITPKFVRKYMSFSTNSFVFINACLSDDADFKQACIDKGASLYAGWSSYADPTAAIKTARYLYDRLLGVNKALPKEDPPQRPFGWGFYYTDMKTKGLDKASTVEYGLSELKMTQLNGNFYILAPTIVATNAFQMEREIHIGGEFGADPGLAQEITLNGTVLRVKRWRHDNIICEAPMSGSGASGDLLVKIRGRKSNVMQISEWRGVFNYVLTGPGTLKVEATLNLNFRGSLNKYRLEAGGPAEIRSDRLVTLLESSSATYNACGMYMRSETSVETWSGGGSIPLLTSATQTIGFGMSGSFLHLTTGLADLSFGLSGVKYQVRINSLEMDQPFTLVMNGIQFRIDSQNRIVGGSHTVPLGQHGATMTWSTITPLHPPTADYAR